MKSKLSRALFATLIATTLYSCKDIKLKRQERRDVETELLRDTRFEIVIIDSCEYILLDKHEGYAGMGGICHKQNCKFCLERNK